MMNILVPTDLSANANHATSYAALIARATRSVLTLLNVVTPPLTRNHVAEAQIESEVNRSHRHMEAALREKCKELAQEFGIPCYPEVKTGGAVDEIVRYAGQHGTDLIVMGTKGAGRIERFLFGSNTAEVIESTPCPVLAVPVSAKLELPGKVVFATNYYDSDFQSLRDLTTLADQLGAEVTILHVAHEGLKGERDLIEQFSRSVSQSTGLAQPYYYVLSDDNVQRGINKFIDSTEAELIALSTRKRTLFEKLFDASLTKDMAYQARLPLLAFQATAPDFQNVVA